MVEKNLLQCCTICSQVIQDFCGDLLKRLVCRSKQSHRHFGLDSILEASTFHEGNQSREVWIVHTKFEDVELHTIGEDRHLDKVDNAVDGYVVNTIDIDSVDTGDRAGSKRELLRIEILDFLAIHPHGRGVQEGRDTMFKNKTLKMFDPQWILHETREIRSFKGGGECCIVRSKHGDIRDAGRIESVEHLWNKRSKGVPINDINNWKKSCTSWSKSCRKSCSWSKSCRNSWSNNWRRSWNNWNHGWGGFSNLKGIKKSIGVRKIDGFATLALSEIGKDAAWSSGKVPFFSSSLCVKCMDSAILLNDVDNLVNGSGSNVSLSIDHRRHRNCPLRNQAAPDCRNGTEL